ncbi:MULTISPECIES: hypothetical protein [unclassified Streptomyces]|uniref:hypothetical protein n=1 Tax=unclassified Streptomyces TaxID=2593676 RepID=UPI00037E5EB4|nr:MULTISPECIES: hypothetical protein [unclassified Streptomyces]
MTHCEDWDLWLALRRTLGYRFAFLGETTSVYHQLPHPSAVSTAYLTSPTPFTRARARLYEKWPAADPLVTRYRDWFRNFDARLDSHIKHGHPIPPHVYEQAVRSLHPHFTTSAPPAALLLDTLLPTATRQEGRPHTSSGHVLGTARAPR